LTALNIEEGEGLGEYKDVDEEEEEEEEEERCRGRGQRGTRAGFKSGYRAQCNCSCTTTLSVITTLYVCSANEPVQSRRWGAGEWTGLSAEGHPP